MDTPPKAPNQRPTAPLQTPIPIDTSRCSVHHTHPTKRQPIRGHRVLTNLRTTPIPDPRNRPANHNHPKQTAPACPIWVQTPPHPRPNPSKHPTPTDHLPRPRKDANSDWIECTGRSRAQPILAGCATLQYFQQNIPGSDSYKVISVAAFSAADNQWIAWTLTPDRVFQRYEGAKQNSGDLTLTRKRKDNSLHRHRYHDINQNTYKTESAISHDNGQTWTTLANSTFTRVSAKD